MIDGKPSLAGAGFINVRVSPAWLAQRIQTMLQQVTTHAGASNPFWESAVV